MRCSTTALGRGRRGRSTGVAPPVDPQAQAVQAGQQRPQAPAASRTAHGERAFTQPGEARVVGCWVLQNRAPAYPTYTTCVGCCKVLSAGRSSVGYEGMDGRGTIGRPQASRSRPGQAKQAAQLCVGALQKGRLCEDSRRRSDEERGDEDDHERVVSFPAAAPAAAASTPRADGSRASSHPGERISFLSLAMSAQSENRKRGEYDALLDRPPKREEQTQGRSQDGQAKGPREDQSSKE